MKNLTKSQQELVRKLNKFLNGPDKYFLIRGKPGVGKTFSIRACLDSILKREKEEGQQLVAGICLAHQAKNQLRLSIPNVYTFAKAYGLVETYDEKTGNRMFKPDNNQGKQPNIGDLNLRVFVHDEVSQYTDEMLRIVDERTSIVSKVIFMGDKAQLPPIEPNKKTDEDSSVWNWEWNETNSHTLTERIRQSKGNPLLDLTDVIRDEIFMNQSIVRVTRNISDNIMSDGVGFCKILENDIYDLIKNLNETSNSVIISHTNNRVNFLNKKVRDYLLNNPKEVLVPNDKVYMKDNFRKLTLDGYPLYTFENSETLTIRKTEKRTDTLKVKDLKANVEYYACKVDEYDQKIFYGLTLKGRLHFNAFLKELYEYAVEHRIQWKTYWDIKKRYCNYNYNYAITSYKCQGSTYDNVFTDISNILNCYFLSPKRKLQSIYTAMTRAKYGVYIIK